MKFQRDSKKAHRQMMRDVDKLAGKDRKAKLQGKIKKLCSEGLRFLACCLMGGALGLFAGCMI